MPDNVRPDHSRAEQPGTFACGRYPTVVTCFSACRNPNCNLREGVPVPRGGDAGAHGPVRTGGVGARLFHGAERVPTPHIHVEPDPVHRRHRQGAYPDSFTLGATTWVSRSSQSTPRFPRFDLLLLSSLSINSMVPEVRV